MSDIFPRWTNRLPLQILIGAALVGTVGTLGVTYYLTPKYSRVGYQPIQPVNFPHSVHADQLGIDCRYCHNGVEKSWYSNIPGSATCMNCHNQVLAADPRLQLVRDSAATGKPIDWVQIHKTPDYVYFNHSVHVNRGISCVECHGQVNKMDEVKHAKPFSMTFCLDCHRDPAKRIRPQERVFDLNWTRESEGFTDAKGHAMVNDMRVESLQNCSTCHR
jgi:hypothetical protein